MITWQLTYHNPLTGVLTAYHEDVQVGTVYVSQGMVNVFTGYNQKEDRWERFDPNPALNSFEAMNHVENYFKENKND